MPADGSRPDDFNNKRPKLYANIEFEDDEAKDIELVASAIKDFSFLKHVNEVAIQAGVSLNENYKEFNSFF